MKCLYRHRREVKTYLQLILNSALEGGVLSATRSGCFTHGKDILIVQQPG
jgi:hypothetical protein